MHRYVTTERLDPVYIASELYDFSKIGALSIPDVLTDEARWELLEATDLSRQFFSDVQRQRGKVIQEMKTLYLERFDPDALPVPIVERARRLSDEYAESYEQIARLGSFGPKFNSLGFHYYPKGTMGITPHQDYADDSNLIASFVLSGNARFFVCLDRDKRGSIELPCPPGSVILMRAARSPAEQTRRPFHYIPGPMEQTRESVLIRTRTNEKKAELEKRP